MKKEIISTLTYADIFDYPLKEKEIYRFLISDIRYQILDVGKGLKELPGVSQKNNFYFLKEREHLVLLRKKRERWSKEKLKIVQKAANWLKIIPTIKMVAVTGALAMENSNKNDDIDLLIITSKNRLWLTRFLTVILLELVAKRRHPADKEVKDKICLNMFLDEGHLKVPEKEQDLFSAHEVYQMKPVWDRGNTYLKFLQDNLWVRRFLPNSLDIKKLRYEDIKGEFSLNYLISQLLNFFENLAYKLQLVYMKSRKTSEITNPSRIRFHPKDAREWVLREYSKRLKKLNLQ